MSVQTQSATVPAVYEPAHAHQAPDQSTPPISPSASASASSQLTPHFSIEPPTPTTAIPAEPPVGSKNAHVTNEDAPPTHHIHNGPPQHIDAISGSPIVHYSALRASPTPYSRHSPYARSVSSFEDATDSHEGGPVRNRRHSYSHRSRSSYDSGDGDYTPSADEQNSYPEETFDDSIVVTKTPRAKEPIRLTSTGKPSHARKLPPGHVKRPRNAFILFRSHACVNNLVPASLGITDHRHISRIVGQMWKNLPVEERKIWEEQAEKEKEEHRLAHPDYKYRPVYRREGVVRRRRRKPQDEEAVGEEERKCEVVARVLLEGGDVSEGRVEKEIEIQRERDEVEGRVRGPSSRSPSRAVRRQSLSVRPYRRFDLGFDALQYGHQSYDSFGGNGGRHFGHQRQASLNVDYRGMDVIDVDEANHHHHHQSLGAPFAMQRSHTMPPFYEDTSAYFAHSQYDGGRRTAPPQPLSLFHPGDASLVPPASPGTVFRAGTEPVGFPSVPPTPRTLAMQQHSLSLQQRLRGNHGSLLSPRTIEFGHSMRQDATLMDNGDTLISPSRAYPQGGGLGFEDGFLDSALHHTHTVQPQTIDGMPDNEQPSLDDPDHQPSDPHAVPGEHAVGHHRPGWTLQQYQLNDGQHAGPPGENGDQTQADSVPKKQQQTTSPTSIGMTRTASVRPPALTSPEGITLQPEADVAYVFLDAQQAQDQVLVDSIRAQGFGITLDASQEEIDALAAAGTLPMMTAAH